MITNWQTQRTMTGRQYSAALKALGLNQSSAARYLGIPPRQSRRYVSGDAEIPTPTALLLRSLIAHGDKPIVPTGEN